MIEDMVTVRRSLLMRCLDALRQHDRSYHYITPNALMFELECHEEAQAREERRYDAITKGLALRNE